ncbi:hypothetical protein TWF730_011121 [Orbilia blumenaviensis]|uniref:Uncharacterized protein n=1 Tax=Orbilia blumenaviensis TaxID=1796055 RepID=A0AAV9UJS0_9PEZI
MTSRAPSPPLSLHSDTNWSPMITPLNFLSIIKGKMNKYANLLQGISTTSSTKEEIESTLDDVCAGLSTAVLAIEWYQQAKSEVELPKGLVKRNLEIRDVDGMVAEMGRVKDVFGKLEKLVSAANDASAIGILTQNKRITGDAGERCVRCDKPLGDKEPCEYHDGKRKLDIASGVWDGVWDDVAKKNCCIDWEDPKILTKYAKGFKWDCCDEDGASEGCASGVHIAAGGGEWK